MTRYLLVLVLLGCFATVSFEGRADKLDCSGCINTKDIGKQQVTRSKLRKNAVNSSRTKNKSLKGVDIKDGTITGSNIAPGTITADKLDPALVAGLGGVADVARSGGDYTSPADAMNDLATWCGTPSTSNPCLLRIAPGFYDLGGDQIVMQENVSIRGAGREVTFVQSAVSSGLSNETSAVVVGARGAALSDLLVINTGGDSVSIAVYNGEEADTRIERVTAIAQNGLGLNYGVYNFDAEPILTDVTTQAFGGAGRASGIHNVAGSAPVMTHVEASAGGAGLASAGIFNSDSRPRMTDVAVTASGTAASGVEFQFSSGRPLMVRLTASVSNAGGCGVRSAFSSNPVVLDSILQGESPANALCISTDSGDTRVANSLIIGDIDDQAVADTNCHGLYSLDFDTDVPDC